MSVSLRVAFKEIFSTKYFNSKFFICLGIISILNFALLFFPTDERNILTILCLDDKIRLISTIITFFISIFISGFYIHYTYNYIHKSDNISFKLPEVRNILITGIKYSVLSFILNLIVYFIPILIFLLSMFFLILGIYPYSNNIGFTYQPPSVFFNISFIILVSAIIVLYLLTYFIAFPLKLMFFKSLNIKDLFDFKKARELRKQNIENYQTLFFKSTFMYITVYIVFYLVSFKIFSYMALNPPYQNLSYTIPATIWNIIFQIFIILYFANLNGQFLRDITPKVEES